jgi:hypothetical protein
MCEGVFYFRHDLIEIDRLAQHRAERFIGDIRDIVGSEVK